MNTNFTIDLENKNVYFEMEDLKTGVYVRCRLTNKPGRYFNNGTDITENHNWCEFLTCGKTKASGTLGTKQNNVIQRLTNDLRILVAKELQSLGWVRVGQMDYCRIEGQSCAVWLQQ